ncbi:MAG: hypothetical protein A2W00_12460 [Candidatus Eisenbacteria bacterium RBG_16_71_46]|nr:MAG: hypothetical protein A2W00_12460 [Candidatus Eisenbacteria bacterium RBG_16_71_46]
MGRLKAEQPSERKRAANRENARRPRGRWAGTPERAALDEAKRLLREAIPDGARFLAEMLGDPKAPSELRLQAFKIAADRAGLPVLTEQRTMGENLPPILVRVQCPTCSRDHNLWEPETQAAEATSQS